LLLSVEDLKTIGMRFGAANHGHQLPDSHLPGSFPANCENPFDFTRTPPRILFGTSRSRERANPRQQGAASTRSPKPRGFGNQFLKSKFGNWIRPNRHRSAATSRRCRHGLIELTVAQIGAAQIGAAQIRFTNL
jgi:hypothetical protein